MAPTLADLFASPDHYFYAFDDEDAVFAQMDRAAYRRSIFLDERIEAAAPDPLRVPLAELARVPGKAEPTNWIFHIAHCGSTLLARALDELGDGLVLREPFALRQLGLSPDPGRLALVLRMFGKRYPDDAATLVKANVPVNFILPEISAADPDAPAILLHYGLRDYLLAILRSGGHRQWLRNVTSQLPGHLGDLSGLADAELAAALWVAQLRRFATALDVMANARTLDAETFFAEPAAMLSKAAALFGIAADDDAIARLVEGPLFHTYSKNPGVAFANHERLARRASLEKELAPELTAAEQWLRAAAPDADHLNVRLNAKAL